MAAAHFVMVGEGTAPVATIARCPDLPGGPWYTGRPVQIRVPEPLTYVLDPDYPGVFKALYGDKAIPIIRDDLLGVLQLAGVDNLETFPALVLDPETGEVHSGFKAFNVVGAFSLADLGRSTRMGDSRGQATDVDFDRLVLDETKRPGLRLFRLAEKLSAIIVDEAVKDAVARSGIGGIVFYESGTWSG
jgi:hypothetical protein